MVGACNGKVRSTPTPKLSFRTVNDSLIPDPRLAMTQEDFEAQFDLLRKLRDKLSEANVAIDRLRRIQRQSLEASGRATKAR